MKRGEIWIVAGGKDYAGKPRPAVILQDDRFDMTDFDSVEAVIRWVNERPRPLGLYVFTEDVAVAEQIIQATESGDAAINDCTIHPLIPELPFGDVGNSGMGKYHGRWGFEAFTNARGVTSRLIETRPNRGDEAASLTKLNALAA